MKKCQETSDVREKSGKWMAISQRAVISGRMDTDKGPEAPDDTSGATGSLSQLG